MCLVCGRYLLCQNNKRTPNRESALRQTTSTTNSADGKVCAGQTSRSAFGLARLSISREHPVRSCFGYPNPKNSIKQHALYWLLITTANFSLLSAAELASKGGQFLACRTQKTEPAGGQTRQNTVASAWSTVLTCRAVQESECAACLRSTRKRMRGRSRGCRNPGRKVFIAQREMPNDASTAASHSVCFSKQSGTRAFCASRRPVLAFHTHRGLFSVRQSLNDAARV